MRRVMIDLVAGGAVLCPHVASAQSAVAWQFLARSGQQAPWGPAGTSYSNLRSAVINDAGEVAFQTSLGEDSYYVAGPLGNLKQELRVGGPIPSDGSPVFEGLARPNINTPGQFAVQADQHIPSTDLSGPRKTGIWTGPIGSPQLAARGGTTAPESTISFNGTLDYSMNASGQIVIYPRFQNSSDRMPLWTGTPGNLKPVFLPDRPISSSESIYCNMAVARPALNDRGEVLVGASLVGGSGGYNGLLFGTPGNLQVVARKDTPAPGGGYYGDFWFSVFGKTYDTNSAGQVAFFQDVYPEKNDQGQKDFSIFVGTPNSLKRVVGGPGQEVPGFADYYFHGFLSMALSDKGQLAFNAVAPSRDRKDFVQGLWMVRDDKLQMIVSDHGNAPDLGPGITCAPQWIHGINDAGQVLFSAMLSGTGVTDANDQAFYLTDAAGNPHLIAREGSTMKLPDGRIRTIRSISLAGSNDLRDVWAIDGGPTVLNDAGQFIYSIEFKTSETAIVIATVPEPGALSLLMLGIPLAWRRRR